MSAKKRLRVVTETGEYIDKDQSIDLSAFTFRAELSTIHGCTATVWASDIDVMLKECLKWARRRLFKPEWILPVRVFYRDKLDLDLVVGLITFSRRPYRAEFTPNEYLIQSVKSRLKKLDDEANKPYDSVDE